jgi:hypothetical protein
VNIRSEIGRKSQLLHDVPVDSVRVIDTPAPSLVNPSLVPAEAPATIHPRSQQQIEPATPPVRQRRRRIQQQPQQPTEPQPTEPQQQPQEQPQAPPSEQEQPQAQPQP